MSILMSWWELVFSPCWVALTSAVFKSLSPHWLLPACSVVCCDLPLVVSLQFLFPSQPCLSAFTHVQAVLLGVFHLPFNLMQTSFSCPWLYWFCTLLSDVSLSTVYFSSFLLIHIFSVVELCTFCVSSCFLSWQPRLCDRVGAVGWSLWKLEGFVSHLLYYEVAQGHFKCAVEEWIMLFNFSSLQFTFRLHPG